MQRGLWIDLDERHWYVDHPDEDATVTGSIDIALVYSQRTLVGGTLPKGSYEASLVLPKELT